MSKPAADPGNPEAVENVLRRELAHGDAMLGSVVPVLRHLLRNEDASLFGDEIVARVRGMAADIAGQLIDAAGGSGLAETARADLLTRVADGLIGNAALIGHLHALAIEWQLTDRLHARLALDPVLPPLLQALIASPNGPTSTLGMNLLAAQSRFTQAQRRMKLPLAELPAHVLHAILPSLHGACGDDRSADLLAEQAEATIRAGFDESRSRLGLIARIVSGMGAGAVAALSVAHGGVAVFLSALAIASGQERDIVVLATHEAQLARLALSLRAAGLGPDAMEEQMLALHPDVTPPAGFERIGPEHAAALLAVPAVFPGA